MESIAGNGYPIHFDETGFVALHNCLETEKYSSLFLLVDSNTNEFCSARFLQHLATDIKIEIIEIEAGESLKSIETCVQIWQILTELGADRKSLLLSLGGGVISDLGGFIASTYKRGIDFIHIPTTLLAMVDAAIGGKNGVDLGSLKNQIGVITVPKMVLIDTTFLETLPQNQMRSGLAEMLKHGLIADREYWTRFTDLSAVDFADFDELIYRSIEIKNDIVLQDPTENGVRKALNFGHTLGHAIESYFMASDDEQTLLHGEAVAVGMVLESYLSWQLNLISESDYRQIKSVIKNIFSEVEISATAIPKILDYLIHDKKNEYGKIQFALLDGIGHIKTSQHVENDLLFKAFTDYKS